jgi:hypothetical protein
MVIKVGNIEAALADPPSPAKPGSPAIAATAHAKLIKKINVDINALIQLHPPLLLSR